MVDKSLVKRGSALKINSMYSVSVFLKRKFVRRNDSIVCDLPMNPIVLMPDAGYSDSRPYNIRVEPKPIYSSISPVVVPEIHSKQRSGFSFKQIPPSCFW